MHQQSKTCMIHSRASWFVQGALRLKQLNKLPLVWPVGCVSQAVELLWHLLPKKKIVTTTARRQHLHSSHALHPVAVVPAVSRS